MHNILFLTSSFPKNKKSYEGGFVFELVKRIAKKGFNPIVLAPHYPGGKIRDYWDTILIERFLYFFPSSLERLAYYPGIPYNAKKDLIAFLNILPFLVSEFFWALKNIFFSRHISLIHTHWIVPQGLIGAIFHALTGIPHVSTIHGSDLSIIGKNSVLKSLCRFTVKNSDVITVNSSYTKEQLVTIAPESKQKIQVIPMGVNPQQFYDISNDQMKKKFQNNQIILSVGRLIDLKGTVFLVESLPYILNHYPNTLLIIIGSGPEEERLHERVESLSLKEHVTFLGTLNHEDLIPYYHLADVFILPSIFKDGKTEALGVVLLEAMASGCPVIGSNVGGIPDIIRDGENGFLVPEQNPEVLAEKITAVLSNRAMADRFRQEGYDIVQSRFSWDIISSQFTKVYERVIGNLTAQVEPL